MKFRYKLKYLFLVIAAVLLTGVVSCVDKDIDLDGPNGQDILNSECEGFALSFAVKLDKEQGSRAGEDRYDNYIDTKDKFRILFFDKATGDFIFEAIDRTVTPISDGDSKDTWYVHIPVNEVIDRDGNAYDSEALRKYLREHDFKVSILANWPNGDYVVGDGDSDFDSDSDGSVLRPEPYQAKGEPKWGYYHSIMATETERAEKGNVTKKNIFDLHHLEVDDQYNKTDNDNKGQRPSSLQTYGFLMEDGKMGAKTSWVANSTGENLTSPFTSSDAAATWIRQNWDPSQAGKVTYLGYYDYLWYLWNFTAAFIPSKDRFSKDISADIREKWIEKNHSSTSNLHNFIHHLNDTDPSKVVTLHDTSDDAELYFDPEEFTERTKNQTGTGSDGNPIYDKGKKATQIYDPNDNSTGNKWVALRLPNKVENGTGTQKDKNNPFGIRFTAQSSGTLRIKCGAVKDDSGNEVDTRVALFSPSNGKSNNIATISTTTQTYITRNVSITGDKEDLYIYCDQGVAVDIYEIEYICDQYLYETYKEAVMPSENNPIPMYGVQDFKALGNTSNWKETWLEGITFNLSNSEETNGKNIHLLRSLAKIEVLIPESTGQANKNEQPKHVFMRCMNRYAYCEPMDVSTPTEIIWNNNINEPSSAANYHQHAYGHCEWFNVQKYGCVWTGSKGADEVSSPSNVKDECNKYQNWLSWFYGTWQEDHGGNLKKKWDFNTHNGNNGGATITVPTPGESNSHINNEDLTVPKYPHIFNPRISRSDYARMHYSSFDGTYYHYVIYMPEKYIDDPNYPGVSGSLPKVAHIEFRYDDDANFNDNNCYRVYFTEYPNTYFNAITHKDKFESDFEKDPKALQSLWPIMRNHVYRFTLKPGNQTMDINVKVKPWGYSVVDYPL